MIDIINDNFNDLAKDYYKLQEKYEQLQQELNQKNKIIEEIKKYCKKTHYYGISTIGILKIIEEIEKGSEE